MTQRVPDDVVARFTRQQHDWTERVLKGSLDPVEVAQAVQDIINRKQLFKPHSYFKNRKGFAVYRSFQNYILSKTGNTIPYRGLDGVTSYITQRQMSDTKTIDDLLGGMKEARKYSFTLDQIAAMIDFQSNGEDGNLLNNGSANIFYVLVNDILFAVGVTWDTLSHVWYMSAWHLDKNGLCSTSWRVFHNTTLTV